MFYEFGFDAEEFEGSFEFEGEFETAGVPGGPPRVAAAKPAAKPTGVLPAGVVGKPCPVKTKRPTTDRCLPGVTLTCPAVLDRLCVTSVGGVPFEYAMLEHPKVGPDGLKFIGKRIKNREQMFTPPVAQALVKFLADMAGFGMPVEAILTGGSHLCRCIRNTKTLSNHSYADAIDVVGLRWKSPTGVRETIVHNYNKAPERAVLRRINACLRLSFATVIDYHHPDHRDHFHCDTNQGKGRFTKGGVCVVFIKEALNVVLGLKIPETTKYTADIEKGLAKFSGLTPAKLKDPATFSRTVDELFKRVAQG